MGRTVAVPDAPSASGSKAQTLSLSGLLLGELFDDGFNTTYQYDPAARVTSVSSDGAPLWTADSIDAAGRVVSEHYGNGATEAYQYDPLGLASRVTVTSPVTQTSLYDVVVQRNSYGAPTLVTDQDGQGLDQSASYSYDGAGRLKSATLGSAGANQYAFGYQYDALQNMTLRTETGPQDIGIWRGPTVTASAVTARASSRRWCREVARDSVAPPDWMRSSSRQPRWPGLVTAVRATVDRPSTHRRFLRRFARILARRCPGPGRRFSGCDRGLQPAIFSSRRARIGPRHSSRAGVGRDAPRRQRDWPQRRRRARQRSRDRRRNLGPRYVVYPHGHASGASLIHRALPSGTEDYLSFDVAPAVPEVNYDLALGKSVAGLRLVAGTLEMLDRGGAPIARGAALHRRGGRRAGGTRP